MRFDVTKAARIVQHRRMAVSLFRRKAEDPKSIGVTHDGETYEVVVKRRAAARRLTLRISHATGEVVLTLPERSAVATAVKFAHEHSGWIAHRVKRMPAPIALTAGAVVPYRGVPHRIVRWSGVRGIASASQDGDGAPIIAVSCDAAHVGRRVKDFLRGEAARDLGHAVRHYTEKLGIPAKKITVRDTRTRWGSCSAGGRLSFSWRLVLAPPFVLDYLAAHEVAHLKEMNHSMRFWRLVHRLCPQTEEAERWLKRHGSGLHRYG
jgi:predicted metal-dependent hydrolase